MNIPLVDWLSDKKKEDIESGVDVELDDKLDAPLGGGLKNRDLDESIPEQETLKSVEADPMMENKQDVKVNPESGDGPDIDDPEPTMEAVELGTETRRAMQEMDSALRELDDV